MSGKQQKRLRKIAKGLAVVAEEAGRKIDERGTSEVTKTSVDHSSISSEAVVRRPGADPFEVRTVVNRQDTLRGIVRNIKKGVKSGKVLKPTS